VGRLALIAVFGVVLLAGCGGSSLYTVAKTQSCLASEDAHIGGKLDFVASTATGGAFVATLSDNSVTIVFGAKQKDAADIATAYQRFALPNVRNNIQDVLERYGNAVLLWHLHPASADLALVTGCLK
jgi:hypothetical protein